MKIAIAALAGLAVVLAANTAFAQGVSKERMRWLAMFQDADTDGDGGLSRDELAKAPRLGSVKKNFDAMDADKDGKVTVAEHDAWVARPKAKPAPKEPRAARERRRWLADFKYADKNADGGLSKDELAKTQHFSAIKKNFAAMDGDKDGKVTVAERDAWVNAQPKAKR